MIGDWNGRHPNGWSLGSTPAERSSGGIVRGHRLQAWRVQAVDRHTRVVTPPGRIPGQAAGLELRHRQHARVEDRIREAKASGLRNLPCRGWDENAAWLEVVLTAIDLVTWTKTICFTDAPELARCEIATFRYRVLHVAARITRSARQTRLRIDTPGAGRAGSPPPSTASGPRSPDTRHPRPDNQDHGDRPPDATAGHRPIRDVKVRLTPSQLSTPTMITSQRMKDGG